MAVVYPPGFSDLFVQRLNFIHNNLSYAWLSYIAMREKQVGESIAQLHPIVIDDVFVLPFKEILSHAKMDAAIPNQFVWFVASRALTTLYEAFKDDDIRFQTAKNEDWFMLLASLRHALSHGIDGEWGNKIYCNVGNELHFKRDLDGKVFVIPGTLAGKPIDAAVFGGLPSVIDLVRIATKYSQKKIPSAPRS